VANKVAFGSRASGATQAGRDSLSLSFRVGQRVTDAGRALLERYDWKNGGFGGAPKTPEPAAAEFLLALGLRTGTPFALKAAVRSLSMLPKSELCDPVEGGYFEHCARAAWKEPHTRKTLATNAALLQAFAVAAGWTGDGELRRAATETAAYIDGTLSVRGGNGWAEGQAADEEYYALMRHRRTARGPPEVEGVADGELSARAVSALVRAGICLGEPRWVARARLAFDDLGGKRAGKVPDFGEAEALTTAALDLHCATGKADWLTRAAAFAEAVPRRGAADLPASPSGVQYGRAAGALLRMAVAVDDAKLAAHGRGLLGPAGRGLEGATVATVAAYGMAAMCKDAGTLEVCWGGGRVEGAPAPQAALAMAWALGPPVLTVEGGEAGSPSVGARFRLDSRRSEPASTQELLRARLASIMPLHVELS